jgi:hypothetical protein
LIIVVDIFANHNLTVESAKACQKHCIMFGFTSNETVGNTKDCALTEDNILEASQESEGNNDPMKKDDNPSGDDAVKEEARSWFVRYWANSQNKSDSKETEEGDEEAPSTKVTHSSPEEAKPWYYGGTFWSSAAKPEKPANPRVTKAKQFGGAAMVGGLAGMLVAGPIIGAVLAVAASPGVPGAVVRGGGEAVVNGIGNGGRFMMNSLKPKQGSTGTSA